MLDENKLTGTIGSWIGGMAKLTILCGPRLHQCILNVVVGQRPLARYNSVVQGHGQDTIVYCTCAMLLERCAAPHGTARRCMGVWAGSAALRCGPLACCD